MISRRGFLSRLLQGAVLGVAARYAPGAIEESTAPIVTSVESPVSMWLVNWSSDETIFGIHHIHPGGETLVEGSTRFDGDARIAKVVELLRN